MSKKKKRKTLKPRYKSRRMRRRHPGSGNCSGLQYRGNGYIRIPLPAIMRSGKILQPVRRINFLPRSRGNGLASSNGN